MKYIKKDQLPRLLSSMGAVYAPVEKGGEVVFDRWEEGDTLRLDVTSADKSPKDILFPQWEDLMQFRREGKTIEITEEARSSEDYVIFGARACDIQALRVLDRVFLCDPVDTYYQARRERGVIVGLACAEPEKSCFCTVFGIDPANPQCDVALWEDGDGYGWKPMTEKGEKLTSSWPGQDKDVDLAAIQAGIRKRISEMPFASLNLDAIKGMSQEDMFSSSKWARLSTSCLGCGACTFSCPTCQCYDIRDYDTGHGIRRYRCWDSCMYSDFTLMAGGQPRTTQLQRYRQRFMHKLCYFPENNDGMFSCVGCGRCVRKCPMHLNIAKVIKSLGEVGK